MNHRASMHEPQQRHRPVAFMFPGQGSQHIRMGAGLYRSDTIFTAAADEALLYVAGGDAQRITADWLAHCPEIGIDDVRRAQPLLFAIDYALGSMVRSWGVRPDAVIGHSAGELVAAVFAGVCTLRDAAGMVRERVRHAGVVPEGGMLAVAAGAEAMSPYLTGDVAVAAVNAGKQVMLAGTRGPLRAAEKRLRRDGYTVATVPAATPFHCSAMRPVAQANESAFAEVPLRPPTLRMFSGYTGARLRAEDAISPRFWARQVTETVYFGRALDALLATGDYLLLECGPGQTLTAFARRHRSVYAGGSAVAAMLPAHAGEPDADTAAVAEARTMLQPEGIGSLAEAPG